MKEIKIEELKINPSIEIGNNWMLVSAGDKSKYNTMTASWGSIGALWGHGVNGRATVTIYIRPSRYTDKFIDEKECFSLSFFDEKYKKDLTYLGTKSGRDENKIAKTSLTVEFINEVPYFKEAKLVFICKKLYKGKIEKEGFIEKDILDKFYKSDSSHIYNNESFHNVYVGEIIKILEK